MKYGESTFDILYLLFAVICGCLLLRRAKGRKQTKLMGAAALILGLGDAFHLVPRVLNYFISADFTFALGMGKLVTSLTMTVFYLLLYYIWMENYHAEEQKRVTYTMWLLTAARVILCLFPGNGWADNGSSEAWAIMRNVPFVLLGAAVCGLYFQLRNGDEHFRRVWLYILLSFIFYIPVAVGANYVPMLGMLMLPKTICYVLMLILFLRCAKALAEEQ